MGCLRETLDGYRPLGNRGGWPGGGKQNLDDRLPVKFVDVLEPVLIFTDGKTDIARVPDQGSWSPLTRGWR